MNTVSATISGETAMQEVLQLYPGAQRALFRRYHVGGCSSCGFQPTETLAQVCARNGNLDIQEVIDHLQASHEQDARILISAGDLAGLIKQNPATKLLDIRSRQEFEAVHIQGSTLLSQPVMQEVLAHWPRHEPVVLIDHRGHQGLDAAAYFAGHGFENVHCLAGGIDAWSQEVDPKLPRYRLS
jgi:rhodanese-related sulfurtransferase